MGIYDRDYYRQGGSGFRLTAPRTAVVAIIIVNVVVFLAEIVASSAAEPHNRIVWLFSNHVDVGQLVNGVRIPPQSDTLTRPWMWWQFLTCGFVHDPQSVMHVLFNMMTLFFLGPAVEEWYGTREFLRLYLVMLVFSSVVWAVSDRLLRQNGICLGASGAISGVVVLFALLFPKRTLLFMFVLPLPAWLLGVLAIAADIFGAIGPGHADRPIAYAAHLGGAAFALAYFQLHWNLDRAGHAVVKWVKGHSRPPLKVFKPEEEADAPVAEEEVDRILTKIHNQGEGSLTPKERRIMEHASREYRRRLRPH